MLHHPFPRPAIVRFCSTLLASLLLAGSVGATPSDESLPTKSTAPHQTKVAGITPLPAAFRNGLVFVKVAINGGAPAWMDLDTGTSPSVVVPGYARVAGLTLTAQGKVTEGFGSEKIETFTTSKAMLRAGKDSARAVEFESIELPGMSGPDGLPLSGLLGQSFLAGRILVIDYQKQTVYFRDKPEASNAVDIPITLFDGVPLLHIELDGHPLSALIDSGGAYGLLVTPQALKEAGLEHYLEQAKAVGTSGHGGEHAAVVGKAPDLTLGGMVVHAPSAVYTTLGTTKIPAGASLGKDFLKSYRVTLNYAAGSARFEPIGQ